MPLLHKKPFRVEPVPSDLKPDEEVFVCHATKEVFRDYEKYFNRHFLCNSLVWTCELTGQANLTYAQALQSEREARKVMDSLPECFQKAALSLVHHVRRTNVKTLADEVCAFYRLRFVEGEELGMRKKTASGAEVILPVRIIKVIPPSENSPRSRSRSPLKSASPNSPTKLSFPQQSLSSKSKLPSPPGLHPTQRNSVGSPINKIGSPSKFSSSLCSPPASPTKMNSNSHVVVTVAPPHLPHSPLKSPVRLPVISKVMKSPPPLLPINHVRDSSSASSSLHCSEDPLAVLSRSASGENVKTPSKSQLLNGVSDSAHKTGQDDSALSGGKGSEAKFRTPKTPSLPLSPEIDMDPNDYRYLVEEIKCPENKVVVKPSQIARGRGVLTPKKVKIFLRNALHRSSEKHPFTVKDEYVKKFGLGISSVDLTSLSTPSTAKSRKRSYSQASLESFVTPSESVVSLSNTASSSGSSPVKRARPTSLEGGSRRKSLSSAKKPRKSPKTPSGKSSKSTRKSSTAKSPRRRKSTTKTPKLPKTSLIFPKSSGSSPEKVASQHAAPAKTPKSPKSPHTPRNKLEALKALNKAKKFKQMDLKKSVVVQQEKKKTITEEELAILRRLAEEERQRRIAQREAEKLRRKEERLKKLREQQEQRRLEKLRQKELLKPREDLKCDNSKPLPPATPINSPIPLEQFGDAVMVLEFLNNFGPLFNVKEAIRCNITIEKIENALAYDDYENLFFDIIKFLLQAIFATMEEEHESVVDVKKSGSKKDSSTSGTSALDSEPVEDEQDKSVSESGKSSPVASEESKIIDSGEKKDDGQKDLEQAELTDNIEGAEDNEGEESQPLNVQVESVISSASTFSKWSHLTQSVNINELVLNPHTCSEVLRLHLLSSGGYVDSGERSWFRHSRRGGYSDTDDPAVALRLKRPDILSALAHSSIYSLSVADKLEVLSTLCSQLLTYSVSREFIDEALIRAKQAKRQIREIQFTEERRKKEEKAAIIKEKKEEKARLKKQQESEKKENKPGESGGENGANEVSTSKAELLKPTDTPENSKPKIDNETNTPAESMVEKTSKKNLSDAEPSQKEGSPKHQTPGEDDEGNHEKQEDPEIEKERKEKIKQDIFELNEQLSEAVSAVNMKPLGFDRYHRKYWIFPNLPGLYVEDCEEDLHSQVGPLLTGRCSLTGNESLHAQQAEKCLSPKGIVVQSQATSSFQQPSSSALPSLQSSAIIDLTKESPDPQKTLTMPKPPPLIPISEASSDLQQEQEKRLSVNNSSMISTTSSMFTPGDSSALEDSMVSVTEHVANIHVHHLNDESRPRWSVYKSQDEIDSLLESLNPRGIRELKLKTVIDEQRVHFEPHLFKCPYQSKDETSSSQHRQLSYTNADEYMELYLREQILDIEEKIYLGSLGYLRGVDERARWRDSIENSGAAANIVPNPPSGEETLQAKDTSQDSKSLSTKEQGRSRSTTPFINEDGSRRKSSPPINPSVHELSRALLQVQAGIEKKYLLPPLGMAVGQKGRGRQKEKKVVKESDVCVEEWRASLAKATSFSQIFVHLATLERCVMWSKSLMNVRCRICRRKCGDEFMLLCDGCDHGYHTYCLKPPLKDVPEGDWFCHDCHPVTPVKPRRRAQRVVIVEESSDSEPEEEVQQESEDEEEASDQEEADDEEESEEEELPTTRRYLRSSLIHTTEEVVPSHARKGRPSTRVIGKKQAKLTKVKGKLSKTQPAAKKSQKPEVSVKRPRGRPPGRPRNRPSESSLALLNTSSSTPDSSSGRNNGPSARKKLKLDHVPAPPLHQSKAESVIASIIELRCSNKKGRSQTSSSRREQESLEAQLCEALWEEVSEQEDSAYFDVPVKKREYPDYFDIIEHPMDLRTIKNKIKCHTYNSLDEFIMDMLLIFDNCLKYHKRHSKIGKAGASIKRYFEKRCGNLGLRDLCLCSSAVNLGTGSPEESTRRVSMRNRR